MPCYIYLTPQTIILSKIYPTQSDCCPKCMSDTGTFIHVVWTCPTIQEFWREVVAEINIIGDLSMVIDPRVLLLGIYNTVTPNTHKQLFIFYAAFYARKTILSKWKQAGLLRSDRWLMWSYPYIS